MEKIVSILILLDTALEDKIANIKPIATDRVSILILLDTALEAKLF